MQDQDKAAFRDMMMAAGEVYGREIFTSFIHQELPFKNYEIFFEEEDLEGESNVAKLAITYAQQEAIISQLKMELEMLRNAKTMQGLSSGGCISSNEKIVSASVVHSSECELRNIDPEKTKELKDFLKKINRGDLI